MQISPVEVCYRTILTRRKKGPHRPFVDPDVFSYLSYGHVTGIVDKAPASLTVMNQQAPFGDVMIMLFGLAIYILPPTM